MKRLLDYRSKYGIKQPLRGYQRKAAALGCRLDSYALLMDPRLGKTRVDIAVSGYRYQRGEIRKWIIIAPAVAKDVWAAELAATLNVPFNITIVEGKKDERSLTVKGWSTVPGELSILILNHEATWRLKKPLYKSNPDKVTVDESHKIANHNTKQSGAISTLGRRARFRTIMTGTFLPRVTAAFSQFRFLDPTVFGDRYKDFLAQYVRTYGFGGHKPKTFKNLDDLHARVAAKSFQLTRAEAGGFPDEQYQTIHFKLGPASRRHYTRMEDELKTIVKHNGEDRQVSANIVLTKVLRMQQITAGFLPVECDDDATENVAIGSERIDTLRGLLEEYPDDMPLVIFARFRYEMKAILDLCHKLKRSTSYIAGGMRGDERDRAKHAFQTHRTVNTCVVQVRAGGIAIDLSRADTAIFFTVTQSFIDYEQAKARILARTGGKKSILTLVAEDTVDEDTLASLQERGDLAQRILRLYR